VVGPGHDAPLFLRFVEGWPSVSKLGHLCFVRISLQESMIYSSVKTGEYTYKIEEFMVNSLVNQRNS
jgi:hypothetical protein